MDRYIEKQIHHVGMEEIDNVFNVLEFDDLKNEVKEKVVNEELNGIAELIDSNYDFWHSLNKNHYIRKAAEKALEHQTPWFVAEYLIEFGEKEIMSDIRKRKYTPNGEAPYFYYRLNDRNCNETQDNILFCSDASKEIVEKAVEYRDELLDKGVLDDNDSVIILNYLKEKGYKVILCNPADIQY